MSSAKVRSPGSSVESQIKVIRVVAALQTFVSVVIVVSQTIAIGSSYEFATRSLTGVWTAWFFFMASGLALFWSSRCTFNGLLTVLVLQIIAATMAIPLFTACCILIGVYNFQFSSSDEETSRVGSSVAIMTTNLVMIVCSILEMVLNAYNAFNCYVLAYGGSHKDSYDRRSIKSSISDEGNHEEVETQTAADEQDGKNARANFSMSLNDINIVKCSGIAGLFLALIIFSCQIAMFVLAKSNGINIGIGIWGALYYMATGLVTVYAGWKPTAQSTVAVFVLQIVQFILSIPLVGIALYIVAVFGSCVQLSPLPECGPEANYAGLSVAIMGGVMAMCGMVQGLLSLVLILICSQSVCGVRCMISGATVYPSA